MACKHGNESRHENPTKAPHSVTEPHPCPQLDYSVWIGLLSTLSKVKQSLKKLNESKQGSCFVCSFVYFWDRSLLCSPGCTRTHYVDQSDLELRDLPAPAWVLGLKACATHLVQIYLCVCMYVCMYVCLHIHMHAYILISVCRGQENVLNLELQGL